MGMKKTKPRKFTLVQEDTAFEIIECTSKYIRNLEKKHKCKIMFNIDDIKFK